MRKIISLALLGATSSLMALDAEHAYLYKDPRIMGMGGANVAVGGYSTSVFSNPAGLTQIKKSHGIVVDLLGIGVSATATSADFLSDIDTVDKEGNDATAEMTAVLEKYSGEHFHIGVDNYTAISKNSDAFAWSIGILAAADINYKVHANGGASLLETSSRTYGGVVLGAAKEYQTKVGALSVGLGLKYISQTSIEGGLTINDLLGDDIADTLEEKYKKESTGIGADIGVTLRPFTNSTWHPAVGLSILNIGSMGMDDNYGQQPMTVNVGMSVSPEVTFINSLVIAVDYVDLTNANKVRFYNISADSVVTEDLEESDPMKRLRLGLGLGLIDSQYFSMAVNTGLYQGSYTAGLDLEMTILKLNIGTYEEEIGTLGASNKDRRYMAKVSLGW